MEIIDPNEFINSKMSQDELDEMVSKKGIDFAGMIIEGLYGEWFDQLADKVQEAVRNELILLACNEKGNYAAIVPSRLEEPEYSWDTFYDPHEIEDSEDNYPKFSSLV